MTVVYPTAYRASPLLDVALFLARVPIGLYFAIAGWNKIFGSGVGEFVRANAGKAPAWASSIETPYLWAVPFVEITVGALLIVGLLPRFAAGVMTLMLASFLMAVMRPAYIAHVTPTTQPGTPFDSNFLLIGLTLLLTLLGGGRISLHSLVARKSAERRAQKLIDREVDRRAAVVSSSTVVASPSALGSPTDPPRTL